MNTISGFFLCTFALTTAQFSTYPMWGGIGSPYMSSMPWRGQGNMIPWMVPGMSSMTNTGMWRSHPLFRMSSAASTGTSSGTGGASTGASTSSIVPTSGEKMPVLTIPQNIIHIPKVPSSDEILTHMVLSNANPKPYVDTISDFLYNPEASKARAMLAPVFMTGMDSMRQSGNMVEDCSPQDLTRWNRDLSEWVY